ncbi:hypothetical protein Barb4_02248 [Bacteroidales bacterium Barb4]|nr:hypothetical protein Barb4_02248 [Bacteroidales bacterium Barb4]
MHCIMLRHCFISSGFDKVAINICSTFLPDDCVKVKITNSQCRCFVCPVIRNGYRI